MPTSHTKIALAIADGHVYAACNQHIACFELLGGGRMWMVKRAFTGRAGVVVQDGKVFVACSGEVECYDLAGKRLWANGMSGKGYGEMALGFAGNVVQADITG